MDETGAGPSSTKKRKVDWKKPLTDAELVEILENDNDDDFAFESEDDYYPSKSDDSESSDHDIPDPIQTPDIPNIATPGLDWVDDSSSMKRFLFTRQEELLIPVPGDEPIDYFRHIFTYQFIQEIIKQTNIYAVELFLSEKTKNNSRITTWSKDLTLEEFLVFVGLLLHMGNIRINRLQDYWKQDDLFGIGVFSENMSRNRFLLIMRTLHFAQNPTEDQAPSPDRLYKVRPLITFFNQRMSDIFYPGRELSLDESMVLWRGRLIFRQYIKNKRHKYGIKLYILTTPEGIILKFAIYTGMLDDIGGKGHAEKVVMHLMEGKLGVGHSLYMDNFYNSYGLAKKLIDHETHCTGTLRLDRKCNPKEIKSAKLKTGETKAQYSNGVMVGKWRDKRDVAYISTEFQNEMTEVRNKRQQVKTKPKPIVEYNKYMSGVDRQDQMLSYYPSERKTIRWPTKIFIHTLQMMIMNAYCLYNQYSTKKIPLYEFRLSVIKSLLKKPEVTPTPAQRNMHLLSLRPRNQDGKIPRKHCKNCYAKGKRKDTFYVCTVCPNEPGFCLECSNIQHK